MTPCGDSARLMNPNYKTCTVKLQVIYSAIYVGQCYLGFRLTSVTLLALFLFCVNLTCANGCVYNACVCFIMIYN